MSGFSLQFQLELLFRIVLASLCGFMIGYERKFHYKAAGVKTHLIVALASALMMEVSKYGFQDVPGYDAARLAAQVVSGIGFLGTGIIIKKNQSVEGLTTAAVIWGMSGIGLALGAGMYLIGIACTMLYILSSVVVRWIDKRHKAYQLTYQIGAASLKSIQQATVGLQNMKLINVTIEKKSMQLFVATLTIVFKDRDQMNQWEASMLSEQQFVLFEHYG